MNKFLLIFLLLFFFLPFSTEAEIYKYVDKTGNIAFTDNLNNVPENQRPKPEGIPKKQTSSHGPSPAAPDSLEEKGKDGDRRLLETLKKEYGLKEVCPEETKEQAEQAIKESWVDMTAAIVAGNLETALSHYSLAKRDIHQRQLLQIGKEKLKAAFGSCDSIVIGKIKGRQVECGAIRYENDKRYAYPIRYIKDMDCVWRIDGF
jgi:hypothetical protein